MKYLESDYTFPHKCEQCDEVFDEMKRYVFHRRMAHDPIPEGQECQIGCKQPATHKYNFNHLYYFCSENPQDCPEYPNLKLIGLPYRRPV